jgi:hypothetical protein
VLHVGELTQLTKNEKEAAKLEERRKEVQRKLEEARQKRDGNAKSSKQQSKELFGVSSDEEEESKDEDLRCY